MKRWYNGPQSETMDMIYDHMEEHIKVSELQDWAIISLHLARVVKQIEAAHNADRRDV